MNKSRSRKFWSNVAGTAAIEFAFLALPFAGVTTAAFEAGRACWTLEALQDSAIQGARCIGVKATSCFSSGVFSAPSAVAKIQDVAKAWGVSIPEQRRCGLSGYELRQYPRLLGSPDLLRILVGRRETFCRH